MKANFVGRVLRARATVFAGLAMVLAVVLGVASTATAHTGEVGLFHLGHNNLTSALSTLTKSGAGPALKLNVGSGPPLAVNSSARVANLNADRVDSLNSVMSAKTYIVAPEPSDGGAGPGQTARFEAHCDLGDIPVGGGAANVASGTALLNSFPDDRFEPPIGDGWVVTIQNDATPDDVSAVVSCADNPPFH